jgi:hypothetical protein
MLPSLNTPARLWVLLILYYFRDIWMFWALSPSSRVLENTTFRKLDLFPSCESCQFAPPGYKTGYQRINVSSGVHTVEDTTILGTCFMS